MPSGFPHFAEPIAPRLVVTKDKVVKLKEVKLERPASVSVEEAGDEGVAKAEGHCGKLVGDGGVNLVIIQGVGCLTSKW